MKNPFKYFKTTREIARLAEGPLWQGMLPYPLPLALHGTFVTI